MLVENFFLCLSKTTNTPCAFWNFTILELTSGQKCGFRPVNEEP